MRALILSLAVIACVLPTCAQQAADTPPAVVVVQGDRLGPGGESMRPVMEQATQVMIQALEAGRVRHAITRDTLVEQYGLPAGARVAILPYNRAVSPAGVQRLLRFVQGGGKLIICLLGPPELLAALGVQAGDYLAGDAVSRLAGLDAAGSEVLGMPDRVNQTPGRIRVSSPGPGATVSTWWRLADGARTERPGVILSDNGAFLTSVLPTGGDRPGQGALLRALCGHFSPQVWRESIPRTTADIRPLGNYASLEHMHNAILDRGRAGEDVSRALGGVQEVVTALARASHAFGAGDVQGAVDSAWQAEGLAQRAYWMSYPSRNGELRGVWASNTVHGGWDEAMATLRAHNLNAIFPYVASAGVAWYRSKVLPRAYERDELTLATEAGLRHGIPVHPRTLALYAMVIPDDFRERLRSEGRLMVSGTGRTTNWLCPVHPHNRRLVVQTAVEIMRDYHSTGFHLDYLRYPGADYCLCPLCRRGFQEHLGRQVPNLAQAVKSGETRARWFDWRRTQLTTLMAEIYAAVRAVRPDAPVSAAVFLNWEGHRDHFGQDWKAWVDLGIIDFVAPMSYTPNNERFTEWTQRQIGWVDGKVPLCPGIGVNADNMTFGGPQNLLDQITIARNLHTDGWVIFNYRENLVRDYLPFLSLGATSSPSSFNPFRRVLMPPVGL